jgi:ElaB/YqjD/DUF883 family membrane-anchored ribosome-binding protein
MAAKDAEMPNHYALRDEVEAIAKHVATLRKDIEELGASVARAGGHQAERIQNAASEKMQALETDVRRNPLAAMGIAFGIGLVFGVILLR